MEAESIAVDAKSAVIEFRSLVMNAVAKLPTDVEQRGCPKGKVAVSFNLLLKRMYLYQCCDRAPIQTKTDQD